ncbi:hypothetical protein, partial [Sphingomonas hankookensis]|uniref:hypothetical protein n=1 Tax=Sphingomonas hankookensis TaxID=563996 RepID=UPI000AC461CC
MAASNKNELPLDDLSELNAAAGAQPTAPVEADETLPQDAGPGELVAEDATIDEGYADMPDCQSASKKDPL